MIEAGAPSRTEQRHNACVWKVAAIIPLAIISSGFVYLVIQPDWYRYNDNVTFSVVGEPFCDFNDTKLMKQCQMELKDLYRQDIVIPTFACLTIAPAALLLGLNLIIMSVWFGYQYLIASYLVQLFGQLFADVGLLLFSFHVSDNAIGFNKLNATVFLKKNPRVGDHLDRYFRLSWFIFFSCFATCAAMPIEVLPVKKEKMKKLEEWWKRKTQALKDGMKKGTGIGTPKHWIEKLWPREKSQDKSVETKEPKMRETEVRKDCTNR